MKQKKLTKKQSMDVLTYNHLKNGPTRDLEYIKDYIKQMLVDNEYYLEPGIYTKNYDPDSELQSLSDQSRYILVSLISMLEGCINDGYKVVSKNTRALMSLHSAKKDECLWDYCPSESEFNRTIE